MSPAIAAMAVSIIGISCIMGTILLGNAGDRFGINRIIAISIGVEAIALVSLIWVKSVPELFAFADIFGCSFGGWVPQFPALTERFSGPKSIGTILGIIMMGAMIGASSGPTLAGYIFDVSSHYRWSFLVAAMAAAILVMLIFFIKINPPAQHQQENGD